VEENGTFPCPEDQFQERQCVFCPQHKADGICCYHHEDVEDCCGCTDVAIPSSASVLLLHRKDFSNLTFKTQTWYCGHTTFSGRTREAIISGTTKSVMTHPHVKRRNDKSCQSATKVNDTSVATIVLELLASGTYR